MKKREFLKSATALASMTILPSSIWSMKKNNRIRIAQIGVGGMGAADLNSTSSHPSVDIVGLCDVDSKALDEASKNHSKASVYIDYRLMLN